MNPTKLIDCGVTKALRVIGRKWTMHILYALCDGTKRFGELRLQIGTISPKTLSQRLKELEAAGIVSKKIYPVIPLRVDYSLTTKGKELKEIFGKMESWGAKI